MTPHERRAWRAYITRTPDLLALLCDLDLRPEAMLPNSEVEMTMFRIASVWSLAAQAEREQAAAIVEQESGVADHPWAKLIRAQGASVV
jgi:hypothetical protein